MRDYYVKTSFRCLDDEQVGEMQHRMIDKKEDVARVAAAFKVSVATAYKVTLHRRRQVNKARTA